VGADSGPLTSPARPPKLAVLAGGLWSWWTGLDPLPTVEQVSDQLGQPLEPDPHSGVFGGSPTIFRRYSIGDDTAPITVWFEDDLAVGVEIESPRRSVLDRPLGPPDAILESEVGESWEQHVYGSVGLVLHVRHVDADEVEVAVLYGLAPFDPAEFQHDPLRWAGRRDRYER
jgi:hypothetical protein